MNILFVGQFCIKSILTKYPDKGLDTYKTSEFLIRGFRQIKNVNLRVITAPDVGSYPKLPKVVFRHSEEDGVVSVGFLNLPIIKQILISERLYKEACDIISSNVGKTYVILPYLVHHYVRVGRRLKKRFGDNVIISQIVPDIFFPKKWINKRLNAYAEHEGSKADCFVLFTKAMADHLGVENKPFLVMESVIDAGSYVSQDVNSTRKHNKLRVVYTGALGRSNGVGKLIELMRFMKRDDFELWVTGRGALADDFATAAKQDQRIHFMGTVPKDDVFKYQSEADVLINPRSDSDAPIVTRYMFPSKLMEYMLTGNPALTCRMEGIPEEYYDYVYVSEDDTIEGLADALDKILNLNNELRKKKGDLARRYILENKTIGVQTGRIVNMFSTIA